MRVIRASLVEGSWHRWPSLAIVISAVVLAVGLGIALRGRDEGARCGAGFLARGARCVVAGGACPRPIEETAHGCDAPDLRVLIPGATIQLGPSDWEAEGRVRARSLDVQPFRIDAFEATRARWGRWQFAVDADGAQAAAGMTRDEAAAFCGSRGGRLPTEDEWIAAASSGPADANLASSASADANLASSLSRPPSRYPWGDTGAVCRRAAWGLLAGPCAFSAGGPDTVGAHPAGDSPLGLHDVAGNVSEWVAADAGHPSIGVAKGGSWQTALASELRIWARLELPPASRDARVGVRCAYPP